MRNHVLELVREGTVSDEEVLNAAKEIEFYRSSIIIPGKDRPDLLVSVDKYHHGNTWEQTNQLLRTDGYFMLAPRYFVEFLNHLRSGKPVYDGRGTKVDTSRVDIILDEILTLRNPWRGEWLDARFGNNNIIYHKIKTDGTIEEVTEPLEDCLMKDKTPGIDLDSWLRNPTEQGLPRKNIQKGGIYYWHPRNGYVARFWADSGRANLGCYWGPQASDAALGVRRVKIFEK